MDTMALYFVGDTASSGSPAGFVSKEAADDWRSTRPGAFPIDSGKVDPALAADVRAFFAERHAACSGDACSRIGLDRCGDDRAAY